MTAIRLASKITPTNLTSKEAQEVLDQLVKEKWLAFELEKGVYYIDTRGIAELQGYLREQYGEAMKECTFCLDVVTMGECCTNTNCNVRIHKYCAESQFKNATNPVCPACTAPWSRTNTFGLGLPETAMNPDYQSEEEEEEEDQ
ncbi:hypothetical protein CU098_012364 [Rhizopus stolonifer]|uniref:Non-structural maintenance of chromosomes element 1 homolog n=2 Tax=Mucorineae TaxID=1344963 RepID=A0A367KIU3_RHIST|nr:hypothetical protein CU098_012364 [Rhizopus stolonifer]